MVFLVLIFLSEHGGQIDLKHGTVRIEGSEVPTYCQKQLSCARVAIAETVTIQAGHRMIVETRAKGKVPKGSWYSLYLSHLVMTLWQ